MKNLKTFASFMLTIILLATTFTFASETKVITSDFGINSNSIKKSKTTNECSDIVANFNSLVGITIHVKRVSSTVTPQIHAWSKETGVDVAITNSLNWPNNLPLMTAEGNGWFKYTVTKSQVGFLVRYGTSQSADIKYFSQEVWVTLNSSGVLADSPKFTNPDIVTNVPVQSVSLSAIGSIAVGGFKNAIATVLPATATNKNITWSSSNTAVASVDSTGKVTGVSKGTAIITAKTVDGGFQGTTTVTVTDPIVPASVTIHVKRVSSTVTPRIHAWSKETGVDVAITNSLNWPNNLPLMTAEANGWFKYTVSKSQVGFLVLYGTSQSADIKYFSQEVWITLNSSGVLADSPKFTNPDIITNVPVQSVSLSAIGSIAVGGFKNAIATVLPATATNKNITWSSSNTAVASVDSAGKVTGVSKGTATITAKTVDGGFQGTTIVTVTDPIVPVSITIHVKRVGSTVTPQIHAWSKETGVDVAITNSLNWPNNLPLMTAEANGWFKYTVSKSQVGFLVRYGTSQSTDIKYFNQEVWITLNSSGVLADSPKFTNPDVKVNTINYKKSRGTTGGKAPQVHIWKKVNGLNVQVTDSSNWPNNLPVMSGPDADGWYSYNAPAEEYGVVFLDNEQQGDANKYWQQSDVHKYYSSTKYFLMSDKNRLIKAFDSKPVVTDEIFMRSNFDELITKDVVNKFSAYGFWVGLYHAEGKNIMYTLDGTNPTATNGTLYISGSDYLTTTILSETTIKAAPVLSSNNGVIVLGSITTQTIRFDKPFPIIYFNTTDPDKNGKYAPGQTVIVGSIGTLGSGYAYYTTDGSNPITSPTRIKYNPYETEARITKTTTIKAVLPISDGEYSSVVDHLVEFDDSFKPIPVLTISTDLEKTGGRFPKGSTVQVTLDYDKVKYPGWKLYYSIGPNSVDLQNLNIGAPGVDVKEYTGPFNFKHTNFNQNEYVVSFLFVNASTGQSQPYKPTYGDNVINSFYILFDWGPGTSSKENGINEATTSVTGLILSPNPTEDNFVLNFSNEKRENAVINIHDLSGKLLFTEEILDTNFINKEYSSSTIGLSKGLYLISVKTATVNEIKRLIIK